MSSIDLRCGRWEDVLTDVGEVDAVITDPPYSVRQHNGYRSQEMMTEKRWESRRSREDAQIATPLKYGGSIAVAAVPYAPIDQAYADTFAASWAPRCRSWFVIFGDHTSFAWWEAALGGVGWYTFAPVGWVRTGGTPRFQGDGPACSIEWMLVARPRKKCSIGSLPGHYVHDVMKGNEHGKFLTGQKPVDLMRAIVRDYTSPGDLIVDPHGGSATTLIAAAMEGRRAIGSEMDPATYEKARARLARGHTVDLFAARPAASASSIAFDFATPPSPPEI